MDLLIAEAVLIAFGAAALSLFARWKQRPLTAGPDGLVGQMATALDPLAPAGRVRILGEVWNAELSAPARALEIELPAGAQVRILAVEGLRLIVEPEWYS